MIFYNNQFVVLNKVKINNSLYANLLTQGGNVVASNSLFANSNNYGAFISIGGHAEFDIVPLLIIGMVLETPLHLYSKITTKA